MADLCTVQPSPGKDFGVFASKDIKPGDVVMRDSARMKLERGANDVSDEQIQKAFNSMSANNQTAFLQLHEGEAQYATQLMRIYKANSFSSEGNDAFVYLKFSRINHSCAPNVELTELDNETDTKIVAVKPISMGEEVFISYLGLLQEGSTDERKRLTKSSYGFECACAVCTLTGTDAVLSDGRRRLINVMATKRAGFESEQPAFLDNVNGLVVGKWAGVIGRHNRPLRVPLTVREKVAYGFLTARLLEAEGMVGISMVHAYVEAVSHLLRQLHDMENLIILPSAQYVMDWMDAAVKAMSEIRTVQSKDYRDLLEFYKTIKTSKNLVAAKVTINSYIAPLRDTNKDPSKLFALYRGGGRLLSQKECLKLLKKGKLNKSAGLQMDIGTFAQGLPGSDWEHAFL